MERLVGMLFVMESWLFLPAFFKRGGGGLTESERLISVVTISAFLLPDKCMVYGIVLIQFRRSRDFYTV